MGKVWQVQWDKFCHHLRFLCLNFEYKDFIDIFPWGFNWWSINIDCDTWANYDNVNQHTDGDIILTLSTWWRHQMETFSALLAICAGNSPVPGEFPAQRPVTRSFDVCFDLRLNKRLSKQWWGWWFDTPSRPLWRHSNDILVRLALMVLQNQLHRSMHWMQLHRILNGAQLIRNVGYLMSTSLLHDLNTPQD